MADDTAALVLSLEARFDKFEKAMKEATAVVEKQTKVIEDRFDSMTKVISDKLGSIQGALVNRLGIVGELMTKLGPAGIVAAAGIGLVALAAEQAAAAVLDFGEKMKRLRDLSITTGLSTGDLQALGKAAKDIGSNLDDVTPAIERFVRNWELLRQGSGELRSQLLRLNPVLEKQLAAATSESEAVQLLSKAFKDLTASQAQLLARAAFGRQTGSDALRLFQKGFDLDALQANMKSAGKLIDEGVVKETAEQFEKLVSNFKTLGSSLRNAILSSFAPDLLKTANEWLTWAKDMIDSLARLRLAAGGAAPLQITVNKPSAPREIPIEEQAASSRERIAFLGAAATAEERLKDALLQTLAAVKANGALTSDLTRARNELIRASDRQAVSERLTLGIASRQEVVQSQIEDLYRKRNEGIIRSDEELAQAEALVIKKNVELFEQLKITASNLPNLTRLAIDAQNLAKTFDTFATQSIDTFSNSMADAITGTKSLSDAFRDMTQSILRDIAKLIVKQAVLSAISPLLGTGGKGFFPIMGEGGPINGPAIVGDKGPELFIPSSSGFIVPNKAIGGLGSDISVSNNTEVNIQGSADKETMQAMQAMLAARDKRFVADVATATRELHRRSVRT